MNDSGSHRGWFGNQALLDLQNWTPVFIDFWNRFGAPDGCRWDGETGRLRCEWAEEVTSNPVESQG